MRIEGRFQYFTLIILPIITGCILLTASLTIPVLPAQTPHGTSSEETPRGTIDGVNASFTLNFQPLPFSSLHVYLNGLRLKRGYDYVLGGPFNEQVIFALPSAIYVPVPGDVLVVDYTY